MEEGRRKPAFLVFDIETIADGDLVSRIRYPERSLLGLPAAVARFRARD